VVIEDFLAGEEASFMVMCQGDQVLPLATSQDHKRLLDHDLGPNTGGMGAYSPAPVVTPEIHSRVMREIILPTIAGMKKDGIRYTGFLYAGLMISPDGQLKVLEFNCRLGDPETQPILVRLKSDLYALIAAAVAGRLDQVEAEWDRRTALGVVLAAAGYPEAPRQGDVIHGIPAPSEAVRVFHAGTHRTTQGKPATTAGTTLQTSGGRVLCVTALGDSVKVAQRLAYQAIESIRFDGMQYRKDIGYRAVK
jgi:phosphoribosylamine--glycine ligase